MSVSYDIVIPTVARPSLARLLEVLGQERGAPPERVIIVDDRPDASTQVEVDPPERLAGRVKVLRGWGRGPAAARNLGWRAGAAPWVVFLDDDVVPDRGWTALLEEDLRGAGDDVGGVQGRIDVPLPTGRPATDWERNVAGLSSARWATADMAYRRDALQRVGGFDERFPRAYREDADLAMRVETAGWRLVRGRRRTLHPVRSADPAVSVRLQAGNADDALMRAIHGRGWRERAGASPGAFPSHVVTTVAGVLALLAAAARRPRVTAAGAIAWAAATGRFAWRRIAPGPRSVREVATMLVTSIAIPPAAVAHRLAGHLRARRHVARPWSPRGEAVLFDRDGTLVVDVPYNGDPARVRPTPSAARALARLREASIPAAVVTNQSGVGRGLLTHADVRAVNERVDELLGPFALWAVCPHRPEEGCPCRKPAPGLILEAAARLGVPPERCVVIGDTEADVTAARRAGARGILVPNDATLPEEVRRAPEVAVDLDHAVAMILGELTARPPARTQEVRT